jgi:hypothetical protein
MVTTEVENADATVARVEVGERAAAFSRQPVNKESQDACLTLASSATLVCIDSSGVDDVTRGDPHVTA